MLTFWQQGLCQVNEINLTPVIFSFNYNYEAWGWCRLKLPAHRSFVQQLIQSRSKTVNVFFTAGIPQWPVTWRHHTLTEISWHKGDGSIILFSLYWHGPWRGHQLNEGILSKNKQTPWMNIKNSFVPIIKIVDNNILIHGDAYVFSGVGHHRFRNGSSPDRHQFHQSINTSKPIQNGRYCPDDIFKCILFNENVQILIKTSLKFSKGPINNILILVQIMANWRQAVM